MRTAAWKVRVRAEGPLLIDGTGTRRRLQALCRLGWSQRQLASRLGFKSVGQMCYLMSTEARVHRDTAARIEALYGKLSMVVPLSDGRAVRSAIAKGYAPPLAWDEDTIDDPGALAWSESDETPDPGHLDEVAIERRLGGDWVRLTRPELLEAVRRAFDRDMGWGEVGRVLGVNGHTVRAALDGRPQHDAARAS